MMNIVEIIICPSFTTGSFSNRERINHNTDATIIEKLIIAMVPNLLDDQSCSKPHTRQYKTH
jgi:hypothetical protein